MVTLSIIKGYSPLQSTKLKTSLFCHPFFFSSEITKFVKKTFLRNMIIYNFFEVFKIPQFFLNFFFSVSLCLKFKHGNYSTLSLIS